MPGVDTRYIVVSSFGNPCLSKTRRNASSPVFAWRVSLDGKVHVGNVHELNTLRRKDFGTDFVVRCRPIRRNIFLRRDRENVSFLGVTRMYRI